MNRVTACAVRRAILAMALLPTQAVLAQTAKTPVAGAADSSVAEATTVVVTARKRDVAILDVPVAVTSFSTRDLQDYNIRSFSDYATKTPNLSFAYGNGATSGDPATGISNSRTIAIRGISGGGTTGYYLDDTPLPGAIDVRVLDLHGIEVLKGPQGTLFGESSLGGNVRLITRVPDLNRNDFRYQVEGGKTWHGAGLNGAVEGVGNIVLLPGKLALRVVGFVDDEAGYMTRTYLSDVNNPASPRISVDDQAAQRIHGGSLTALMRLMPDLDLSLRYMTQSRRDNGFPATFAPLPDFKPNYTLNRVVNIQPTARDSWDLPSLALNYRGDGWTLTSSTSYFDRETRDAEDSTEGTIQYYNKNQGLLGLPALNPAVQPFTWRSLRTSKQVSHETRVSFEPVSNLSGTAGVFYSKHRGHYEHPIPIVSQPGSTLLWLSSVDNTQQDIALFGELYYKFLDRYTLTVGNRRYWLDQTDRTMLDGAFSFATFPYVPGSPAFNVNSKNSSEGNNPKIAFSYQASPAAMLYASASKGFRAGGAQPDYSTILNWCADSSNYAKVSPDSLWSYEVGGKFEFPSPGLLLTASAFHIDWDKIQQNVFLANCAFYLRGNAGAAKIDGGELELSGRLSQSLSLRMGLGYERARITEQGASDLVAGTPLFQVPKWTMSVGAIYTRPLNEMMMGFLAADASYTDDSVSANSQAGINATRASYSLFDLRTGVRWKQSELSFNVKNLSNAKPNLGDIGYMGYGLFVDAKRTIPIPQVATLPPRTLTLQYRERF